MSRKLDSLPTAQGWYMPMAEAPDGFWNPYLLDEDGIWWESAEEGRIRVTPTHILRPIGKLTFDPSWTDEFTRAPAATH